MPCWVQAAREASRAAGSRVATNLGAVQARAMENERVRASDARKSPAQHMLRLSSLEGCEDRASPRACAHACMQVAAAATALNAQWRRLGVHVPGFFNKSPAGSETGEPCARAAAPPKDPARETAGPAGTSPTQAARHALPYFCKKAADAQLPCS